MFRAVGPQIGATFFRKEIGFFFCLIGNVYCGRGAAVGILAAVAGPAVGGQFASSQRVDATEAPTEFTFLKFRLPLAGSGDVGHPGHLESGYVVEADAVGARDSPFGIHDLAGATLSSFTLKC